MEEGTMNGTSNIKSSCCKETMTVKGGEEGTYHYECDKCHNPCDIYTGDNRLNA